MLVRTFFPASVRFRQYVRRSVSMRVRSTRPRRTRSSTTGVRLDLSRPLASESSVWLMPGLRAISVRVANRPGLSPISCEWREKARNAASCAMRRLKPTQWASGPKLIGKPKASPFLPRRRPPVLFVPCTRVSLFRSGHTSAPAFSLMSNYTLYNRVGLRLNIAKSWRLNRPPSPRERTMKLRFAGRVYAAALLIAGTTGALAQDKTFELKLSHWVPPSHPLQKALEDWGASVEKDSGGTIKYKVYPAQQLGKAFDHYDMARDGI